MIGRLRYMQLERITSKHNTMVLTTRDVSIGKVNTRFSCHRSAHVVLKRHLHYLSSNYVLQQSVFGFSATRTMRL